MISCRSYHANTVEEVLNQRFLVVPVALKCDRWPSKTIQDSRFKKFLLPHLHTFGYINSSIIQTQIWQKEEWNPSGLIWPPNGIGQYQLHENLWNNVLVNNIKNFAGLRDNIGRHIWRLYISSCFFAVREDC